MKHYLQNILDYTDSSVNNTLLNRNVSFLHTEDLAFDWYLFLADLMMIRICVEMVTFLLTLNGNEVLILFQGQINLIFYISIFNRTNLNMLTC